jgi:2-oxoisovalerate dehydrogenase E1 component
MNTYKSKEEFVKILSELWDRIFKTQEIINAISGVKIITKFHFTDFETDLYIDNKGDTPRYYWDPEDKVASDVEMIQSSETSHKFWMEDLNVPLAIAGRKVIAKGSVQKALKLIPALKPAFALYPQVLRDMGRSDLLKRPEKGRKKRRFSFFKGKKKRYFSLDVLPQFPMHFSGEKPGDGKRKRSTSVQKATDMDLFKTMVKIRAFEEHLSKEFSKGNLPTEAIHLSIGQEAVAAGVCMNLRETDYLNTTHRGHGHIIAKGADLRRMMAEIYGKSEGLCEGKGGSMHVTDGNKGILGANGIVGAGYLLAMGAGFTIKKENRDDISVVIAGDGSVNQGMFHEAMNMISLFGLPVLIVVENNLYGEFTSIERHSALTEIYKRAQAYGLESQRFDGNDVKQIYEEVGRVIENIRRDGNPRLVELMTYRWHGHMEGDPELYRSSEEKERFKRQDPIVRLENEMSDSAAIKETEIEKIKKEVEKEIDEAVEFAQNSPPPELTELLKHVYSPDDETLYTGDYALLSEGKELKQASIAQAINEAISEEMERDEKVFLWGEDVTLGGYFSVTEGLVDRFGTERIIDTPISENGIIGGAVGAAMTGMRPIAEILFSDFLTCCMDPILNQAAKLRYMTGGQLSIPLTIRAPVGGGVGVAAQHSQSMEKFFFGIPGLIVLAPSDAFTAKGLLKSAIRSNNPVLFFEHKLLYANAGKIPTGDYTLPIGKARVVQEGEDVTVVSHLLGVGVSIDAANILSSAGISAEVIDLVTLYPLDTQTILESVLKTGYLVVVEEGTYTGNIGSEVVARVALAGFDLLKAAPIRIAAPECPIPYASNLENAILPSPESVAEKVEQVLM